MRHAPLLILLAAAFAAPVVEAACPPEGWDAEKLAALKAGKFVVDDGAERAKLAAGLLDCLGDPDPGLRDGIAFEAWNTWSRAGLLDDDTRRAALQRLMPQLVASDPADEQGGFEAPFSALVLSEIARSDRISPWMTPEERETLVQQATSYVSGVRDYRGFAEGEGWRHGVAHGADLLMQLALDPAIEKAQLKRIVEAAGTQVAPAGHAYVFGEPERLARPVLFAATRDVFNEFEWTAWLAKVAAPPPGGWGSVFNDAEGLKRRHDVRAFLVGLYVHARDGQQPGVQAMLPGLRKQLEAVP